MDSLPWASCSTKKDEPISVRLVVPIKILIITQQLFTCHVILLVKYWLRYYSPWEKWGPNRHLPSVLQCVGQHWSQKQTSGTQFPSHPLGLMIRVTMICTSGVLPEDTSNLLKVLIMSLNCSETWMTTYCHTCRIKSLILQLVGHCPGLCFQISLEYPPLLYPHAGTSRPTVMPAHPLRPGLPVQSLTLGFYSRYFLELKFPSFPLFIFWHPSHLQNPVRTSHSPKTFLSSPQIELFPL